MRLGSDIVIDLSISMIIFSAVENMKELNLLHDVLCFLGEMHR